LIERLKNIGPASLVAAAFIGPGTVTICTLAGINHGLSLLWALLFSTLATMLLQEMAARLGIVSQSGLGEALRHHMNGKIGKIVAGALVLSAVVIGNAAYEAGNISGAVLGTLFFASEGSQFVPVIIGSIAFILLYIGNYKILERVLVSLVIVMSFCFVMTAFLTGPSITKILQGLFIPTIPEGSLLTVVALIGTTIVPYNLFLHASLVNEKWEGQSLSAVRWDTVISIGLGGLVSMAIIVCASAVSNTEINSAGDLSAGLVPLLGNYAGLAVAVGLFAAGITSAITAPLAAAYAATGILGWNKDLKSIRFRLVWATILILGIIFSSLGIKPIDIIKFAQVANGLLLPFIAVFLLWAVNQDKIMGQHKNSFVQNVLGFLVMAVCIGLGVYTILK
jgi:Mn2+/Fe2+ NRAMP family transporter